MTTVTKRKSLKPSSNAILCSMARLEIQALGRPICLWYSAKGMWWRGGDVRVEQGVLCSATTGNSNKVLPFSASGSTSLPLVILQGSRLLISNCRVDFSHDLLSHSESPSTFIYSPVHIYWLRMTACSLQHFGVSVPNGEVCNEEYKYKQ